MMKANTQQGGVTITVTIHVSPNGQVTVDAPVNAHQATTAAPKPTIPIKRKSGRKRKYHWSPETLAKWQKKREERETKELKKKLAKAKTATVMPANGNSIVDSVRDIISTKTNKVSVKRRKTGKHFTKKFSQGMIFALVGNDPVDASTICRKLGKPATANNTNRVNCNLWWLYKRGKLDKVNGKRLYFKR